MQGVTCKGLGTTSAAIAIVPEAIVEGAVAVVHIIGTAIGTRAVVSRPRARRNPIALPSAWPGTIRRRPVQQDVEAYAVQHSAHTGAASATLNFSLGKY